MDYVITRHELPEQHIVSLRGRRTPDDLPSFLGRAFGELFGSLPSLGASPAGPPFAIYHALGNALVDVEACVPVLHAIATPDKVDTRILPPMSVAATVHVGRYEDLHRAYGAVLDWAALHGFESTGTVHERYLNGPGEDVPAERYETIVEVPIIATAGLVTV